MKTSKLIFSAALRRLALLLLAALCLSGQLQAQNTGLLEQKTPSFGSFQGTGRAIDASGVYLAVGAPESSVGSLTNYGTVTIWTRNEIGVYTDPFVLGAPDAQSGDRFGFSVQFDGTTLAVGTRSTTDASRNAVYLFTRPAVLNTPWPLQARLTPASAQDRNSFGYAISLSGNYLAVGAPFTISPQFGFGSVHIFRRVNGVWAFQQRLESNEINTAGFGFSVSLQGKVLAVGNPILSSARQPAGNVSIYRRTGTLWAREKFIFGQTGTEFFGYSVSLHNNLLAVASGSNDGNFMTNPAKINMYGYDGTDWILQQSLIAAGSVAGPDFVGAFRSVAVSLQNTQMVLGAPEAAYLFTVDDNGIWSQSTRITPSDQTGNVEYGASVVSLGNRIFVGAPTADGTGAVYSYTRQRRLVSTCVTLTTAPTPSTQFQPVLLSVSVRDTANNPANGLVQLSVDDKPCGLVTLNGGNGSLNTQNLRCDLITRTGSHTVKAAYSGSNLHAASTTTVTHITN